MMNTTIKTPSQQPVFNVEPILRKVLIEAEKEHKELQEIFKLMGWGNIPDALKMEIKDDVSAMVKELKGQYSSCDPYVERRRQRVVYWINSYLDGICSLKTAVESLAFKKL